jgi:hypothetical protein
MSPQLHRHSALVWLHTEQRKKHRELHFLSRFTIGLRGGTTSATTAIALSGEWAPPHTYQYHKLTMTNFNQSCTLKYQLTSVKIY